VPLGIIQSCILGPEFLRGGRDSVVRGTRTSPVIRKPVGREKTRRLQARFLDKRMRLGWALDVFRFDLRHGGHAVVLVLQLPHCHLDVRGRAADDGAILIASVMLCEFQDVIVSQAGLNIAASLGTDMFAFM
jgi:hypothetical protein